MLKRLVSTGVAIAVSLGGGAVAIEALGLLRASPAAPGPQRIEATVAYIEANIDPRDLPSEAESEGLWPPPEEPGKEQPKSVQPTASKTAVAPSPVVDSPEATPVKAAGDALAVDVATEAGTGAETAAEIAAVTRPDAGPDSERAALDPAPQPKLLTSTETATTTSVAEPAPGTKACTGSCNAKPPAPRWAQLSRVSELVTCPFGWRGRLDGAAPGGASPCPIALLP